MYTFPCLHTPVSPSLEQSWLLPWDSMDRSSLSRPHLQACHWHSCRAPTAQTVPHPEWGPKLCSWWPFFILLSLFFLLFFFLWPFSAVGLFTADDVLQTSNLTNPLHLSPHLWPPLLLPAQSHLFLFITPDPCTFLTPLAFVSKGLASLPKRCISPLSVKVLISQLWVSFFFFSKKFLALLRGSHVSHRSCLCVCVAGGRAGFVFCFVLCRSCYFSAPSRSEVSALVTH